MSGVRRRFSAVLGAIALGVGGWSLVIAAPAHAATPITPGNIIASLLNGQVNEYTPTGTFVQTLMTAALPAGSAFDANGNLYVPDFSSNNILKRDATTGTVTTFSDNTILGDSTVYNSPESVVFGPGFSKLYVSDANRFGANGGIHVVDSTTGAGLDFFPLATSDGSDGQGESDWLAFNSLGKLYMTNENPAQGVMEVDQTTKDIVQPSFVANLPTYGYAISFDKNDHLWVGDTSSILEFDTSGTLVNTINNANFSTVFAAVLNPAGDTFYAGDLDNGNVYTYDLSGALQGTFNTGSGIAGLSVAGGFIPGSVSTSLSGGGQSGAAITVPAGTPVTDSATLHGSDVATAGGTLTYTVYSNIACSSSVADGGTVTVTNGVVPNSNPVTLNTNGVYYWQASYSGDNTHPPAKSPCGSETETVGTTSNPMLSVGDAKLYEGDSGTRIVRIPVTLSPASSSTVTVQYKTVDRGAGTAPEDYTAKQGTLTFSPGTTSQQILVSVNGNTTKDVPGRAEYFGIVLSNPNGATIHNSTGTVSIIMDDTPTITAVHLDVKMVKVYEGEDGSTAKLMVTLSKPSASPVTVHFATADGSATAPADYTTTSGDLTFAPGETSQPVVVSIAGDTLSEGTETLYVQLSAASGAVINTDVGKVKIANGI